MEQKLFIDVYSDKEFSQKVSKMLTVMYRHHKSVFEDQAVDLEDFIQEIWCQLFESKRFMPDRAWCYETMKNKAIDYLRVITRRDDIAPMESIEEKEED